MSSRSETNNSWIKYPATNDDNRSRIMKSNRGKNTKPELILREALTHNELSGYRLHWKKAPGSPDIAYPGKKVAIFVNGCFWHRCQICKPKLPKTNRDFWANKFKENKERDLRKETELKGSGWTVLVIWECQINKEIEWCVGEIKNAVSIID